MYVSQKPPPPFFLQCPLFRVDDRAQFVWLLWLKLVLWPCAGDPLGFCAWHGSQGTSSVADHAGWVSLGNSKSQLAQLSGTSNRKLRARRLVYAVCTGARGLRGGSTLNIDHTHPLLRSVVDDRLEESE